MLKGPLNLRRFSRSNAAGPAQRPALHREFHFRPFRPVRTRWIITLNRAGRTGPDAILIDSTDAAFVTERHQELLAIKHDLFPELLVKLIRMGEVR